MRNPSGVSLPSHKPPWEQGEENQASKTKGGFLSSALEAHRTWFPATSKIIPVPLHLGEVIQPPQEYLQYLFRLERFLHYSTRERSVALPAVWYAGIKCWAAYRQHAMSSRPSNPADTQPKPSKTPVFYSSDVTMSIKRLGSHCSGEESIPPKDLIKPQFATKADAYNALKLLLCNEAHGLDTELEFTIQTANPLLCDGVMLILYDEITFNIPSLTYQELEFYVYGLAGENNDNPEYLKQYGEQMKHDITLCNLPRDLKLLNLQRLQSGTSLEDINASNGGIRFLHPFLLSKISNLKGVKIPENLESKSLEVLYQTLSPLLTGTSDQLTKLFEYLQSSAFSMDEIADLLNRSYSDCHLSYRNANRDETSKYPPMFGLRILPDSNGKPQLVIVRDFRSTDAEAISQIVRWNFSNHPHYKNLSSDDKDKYIRANSVDGIVEVATQTKQVPGAKKNSYLALVAEKITLDPTGKIQTQIVGVRVVHLIEPEDNPSTHVHGARLHVNYRYPLPRLGYFMTLFTEMMVAVGGHPVIFVHPSGAADGFFSKMGYSRSKIPDFPTTYDIWRKDFPVPYNML